MLSAGPKKCRLAPRPRLSCTTASLPEREREDSFEDVQNCTGVFFTAVHLPAVDNSFMLTGDLRSLMWRAVVDVKYLQNLRKVFQLTDHADVIWAQHEPIKDHLT